MALRGLLSPSGRLTSCLHREGRSVSLTKRPCKDRVNPLPARSSCGIVVEFPFSDARNLIMKVCCWVAAAALCPLSGLAGAEPHQVPQTALYADPRQPDISGLWLLTGNFYFASDQTLPKLKGAFKSLYARRMKAFNEGRPIDDLTADCLPAGMPHLEVVPYPFEIMQTPGRVTILYEYDSVVRRIPLGATGEPAPGDDAPTFYGTSAGHWEGNTLVVETINIRADTQVDFSGLPHSDALKITERFTRKDASTLENRITLTDPKAYAEPFAVTRVYKLQPKWRVAEYVCTENNRNKTDSAGRTGSGVLQR